MDNKLINHGLNIVSNIVELDTDTTVIDLQLLQNLNTNQAVNYIKLSQLLSTLQKNHDELANNDLEAIGHLIDDIDSKVSSLEAITNELNKWSVDLYEKVSK